MAFGFKMGVELNGTRILLRPPLKEEMVRFADYFAEVSVVQYTNIQYAPTIADEEEWWEKTRKDTNGIHWAIVPDGEDAPIGITGLSGINPITKACTSGILIGDKAWWGKRIASAAHLARTFYAVKQLDLHTIQSTVRVPNPASFRALQRVGYRITGFSDRNAFVNGKYVDTYHLSWVNPAHTAFLYPDGVPEYLVESLARAEEALKLAERVVTLL